MVMEPSELPDDVLLHILRQFSFLERARCLQYVNKRWYQLCRSSDLLEELDLTKVAKQLHLEATYYPTLIAIVTSFPAFRGLKLRQPDNYPCHMLQGLSRRCQAVRKLDISFLTDLESPLETALAVFPKLDSLWVEGLDLTDVDVTELNVPTLRQLEHLSLWSAKVTMQLLYHLGRHCHHLRGLNLNNMYGLAEGGVAQLVSANPDLTHLVLDASDAGSTLVSAVATLTRLRQLSISFCEEFTNDDLINLLSNGQELRWLRLRKGHNFSASALSSTLRGLTRLTRLDLTECPLLDTSTAITISQSCPSLTALLLNWCWLVDDDGVAALLTGLTKLRVLDLTGLKNLTSQGLRGLLQEDTAPRLTELCLKSVNAVSDDLLNAIAGQRTHMTVINYYGGRMVNKPSEDIPLIDDEFDYYPKDIFHEAV
eukprot:m.245338 g.245338  ORF g.245338 m.245338 type:complete len:426 (+) comp17468_c0_seq25:1446-2723(+)